MVMKQQKQIIRQGEHNSCDYGQERGGGGRWDILGQTFNQALPIQIINGADVNVNRCKPRHEPEDNTQNGSLLRVGVGYVCSYDWLPLGRQTAFPQEY